MTAITNVTRRGFLGGSAAALGGLVLGVRLPLGGRAAQAADNADGTLNAFLTVAPDGKVTFQNPFCEMGQGVWTSIPTIIAEELDVDLADVTIEDAPPGKDYQIMFGGTMRFTGGSSSVRASYDTLRKAGAAARAMLVAAAASRWSVPAGECTTEPGKVVHETSGRSLAYGDLAADAASLDAPEEPKLKDPAQFRLIGQPLKRTDTHLKVNGKAGFGLDVRVPGMVYAAVKQSPVYGGTVASYDQSAVKDMPGFVAVVEIPRGVAVVADTYWHARKALEALPVEYDDGSNADLDSETLLEAMQARFDEAGETAESEGDAVSALEGAAARYEAVYSAPFLAHATMEPMNCTADVREDSCEIWAPNQGPDFVVQVARQITALPVDAITVHTPFLGGGFGRRFILDYVSQAVTVSKAVGKPVQVIWTREEDTQHDFYRPMETAKLRAGLDTAGMPVALHTTVVGDGPIRRHMAQFMSDPSVDDSVVEGLVAQPYAIPAKRTDYVYHSLPVPIGFWRSVGHSINAFVYESFMDEMAEAAKVDPLEYRQRLLTSRPRELHILETIAEMADYRPGTWTADDGSKRAMGCAIHESFGSLVGEVAEVSVEDGEARVHNVWVGFDCGSYVNPEIIRAQAMSAVVYGLSQTLLEAVTIEKGRAAQANFDTYPILPPDRMPHVEVQVIASGAPMGGVGEPGTPPIAPAVCNAIAKLTGQRIRRLPLSQYDLKEA